MKKLFILCILLINVVQGIYSQELYWALTSNETVATLYYDTNKESRKSESCKVSSGIGNNANNQTVETVYIDNSCANYHGLTNCGYMFSALKNLKSISGLANLNTENVTNMEQMFAGCNSLESLDLSNFNTANVTNMSTMFHDCSSLTSLNLNNFNTSNVMNMSAMFAGCSALTDLDLSNFNTAKVTDMRWMFSRCSGLTSLDVSNFNTENVTDMGFMFQSCSSITDLDVSNINTANVTDMQAMFYDCSSLTNLDLSNFNTANVTNMETMFCRCSSLISLDLSTFNTANVTNMAYLFIECSSLTSLDVSNFNTSSVTNMSMMFSGCSSLTSLDVSNFYTENVTDMYAMFSGCGNIQTIYCNDTWAAGHWEMFQNCYNIKGEDGTTYDLSHFHDSDFAHPNVGGYFTKKYATFTTVEIGASVQYWSSFYNNTRNVKADNSTTVYTATLSKDGKELMLNEIADKIIPCGQAVLMKSTEKEVMFVTANSEGTGDYSTNSLQGTQVDIPTSSIGGTVYTLANDRKFSFFKYTGTMLKGGKAFLVVPGGALARITIAGLDDDATGIERIGSDDSQAPYYDLQGRRVSQPQKGIYVVNGKKVVK